MTPQIEHIYTKFKGKKLANLIKMTLQNPNGKLKIQGQLTEAFGIEIELRQGDALSTTLFNIVLDKVIRNIETSSNGTIFNRSRQYVACTDDVLILEDR